MSQSKKIAEGVFTEDIYTVNDRYPLDQGDTYTKSQIDEMFSKEWGKNTKLILWDEGKDSYGHPLLFWYVVDGDGGWNADFDWAKKHIRKTKDLIRSK